jgi:formate-dependent nitrite reductase membrane component NrfD
MKGAADLLVQGHGTGRIYVIHNHARSASNLSFTPVLVPNWITNVLVLGGVCIGLHITKMHMFE